MRKAICPTLLVVAFGIAACSVQVPQPGSALPLSTAKFTSLLTHAGAALCPVGKVLPYVQGGNETVNIYSFSSNKTCTPSATANAGLIYFVDGLDQPAIKYFLGLAAVGGGFQAGWRDGALAIVVGPHVPDLRLIALASLFKGRATPVFGVSNK